MRTLLTSALFVCLATVHAAASPIQVHVPGTGNLWLAGMPDGSVAEENDSAPDESPAQALGLVLEPGMTLKFDVSGQTSHGPEKPLRGPEGDLSFEYRKVSENGIAAVSAPLESLIGLFLDDSQPSLTPNPPGLDFIDAYGFDMLSPGLKQPFFIGDGYATAADQQQFIVPAGATRLYLGPLDGFTWNDNLGAFEVMITAIPASGSVPEPSSLSIAVIALGVLFRFCGRRRQLV